MKKIRIWSVVLTIIVFISEPYRILCYASTEEYTGSDQARRIEFRSQSSMVSGTQNVKETASNAWTEQIEDEEISEDTWNDSGARIEIADSLESHSSSYCHDHSEDIDGKTTGVSYRFTMPYDGYINVGFDVENIVTSESYAYSMYIYSSEVGIGVYYRDLKASSSDFYIGIKQGDYDVWLLGNTNIIDDIYSEQYTISIDQMKSDSDSHLWEQEYNGDKDHATPLSTDIVYSGVIHSVFDYYDYFVFDLTSDTTIYTSYTFSADDNKKLNYTVFDSTGKEISTDVLSKNGHFSPRTYSVGKYYIQIENNYDAYDEKYSISLVTVPITISDTDVELKINNTQTINAVINMPDLAGSTLNWSSDNTDVAVVNNGAITGVSCGTARVTAAVAGDPSIYASCTVTVKPEWDLSETDIGISPGNSRTIRAVAGSGIDIPDLIWSSSNTEVADVNESGRITAHVIGTAVIRATNSDDSKIFAECNITVLRMRLSQSSVTIKAGETAEITATLIIPIQLADKNITWSTDDNSVVSVSYGTATIANDNGTVTVTQRGIVTAVSKGTAHIKAASAAFGNISAEYTATVEARVDKIEFIEDEVIVHQGEEKELLLDVLPVTSSFDDIELKSSDTSIATVMSDGTVKGNAAGIATITATSKEDESIRAQCRVIVPSMLTSLSGSYKIQDTLNSDSSSQACIVDEEAAKKSYLFSLSDDGYISSLVMSFYENNLSKTTKYFEIVIKKYNDNTNIISAKLTGENYSIPDIENGQTFTNFGLAQGDYVIEVNPGDVRLGDSQYAISFYFLKADNWEQEKNDDQDSATLISLEKEYIGNLYKREDEDYFKFELTQETQVSIAYTFTNKDKNKQKYSRWLLELKRNNYAAPIYSGNLVGEGQVYGGKLSAGEYYIHIKTGESAKKNNALIYSSEDYRFTINTFEMGGIVLDRSEIRLYPGQSSMLNVSSNVSSIAVPMVSWNTGNSSIATVAGGLVTAVGTGRTIVTVSTMNAIDSGSNILTPASSMNSFAGCTVTVLPSEVYPQDVDLVKMGDGNIVVAGVDDMEYTGLPVTFPDLRVYDGFKLLRPKVDYTVSYSNNVYPTYSSYSGASAASAVVKITFRGNYSGQITKSFAIQSKSYSSGSSWYGKPISISRAKKGDAWLSKVQFSTRAAVQPTKDALTYAGRSLEEGVDYTVSYKNNYAVGTATATFMGIGDFSGTMKMKFKITPVPISMASVSVMQSCVYEKGGAKPIPYLTWSETVSIASPIQSESTVQTWGVYQTVSSTQIVYIKETRTRTLEYGIDYTVSYKKNKTASKTGTMIIKGKGLFGGKTSESFYIDRGDISKLYIVAGGTKYGAKTWKSKIKIIDKNGKALKKGADYTLKYQDSTPSSGGSATVMITGKNNYAGSTAMAMFSVGSRSAPIVARARLKTSTSEYMAGAPVTFNAGDIVAYDKGGIIISSKNFDIIGYSGNLRKGKGRIIVRGIGDYAGVKTVAFKINARKVDSRSSYTR